MVLFALCLCNKYLVQPMNIIDKNRSNKIPATNWFNHNGSAMKTHAIFSFSVGMILAGAHCSEWSELAETGDNMTPNMNCAWHPFKNKRFWRKLYIIFLIFIYFQMMAHNTTVQLGGNAFLMCKVAGVDRVGVNWVCYWCWFSSFLLECPLDLSHSHIHKLLTLERKKLHLRDWFVLSRIIYRTLNTLLFLLCVCVSLYWNWNQTKHKPIITYYHVEV